MEVPANTPVVMLREKDGRGRILPIYIGSPEAASIHYALEKIQPGRPLTHDLMVNLLGEFGTVLQRVVVTEIRDETFYAELHLLTGSVERIVSSRPSDAIAIAVRTGSPIYASEAVLEAAATEEQHPSAQSPSDDDEPPEELLAEFQDFIENVSPEDFM